MMALQIRDKVFFLFSIALLVLSTLSYWSSLPSDPARCQVLLKQGFWLKPDKLQDWQPNGCRLYDYDSREAAQCLADRRVVMVGGRNMLTVFESFVKILNPEYQLPYLKEGADVQAVARHVNLDFFWDPELDGTNLAAIRAGSTDNTTRPTLTVLGLERDNVKKNNDVTAWTASIDSLLSDFREGPEGRERLTDSVIFTPLLEPNIPRLSPSPIDMLNNVLASLANKYGVDVAFAFNDVVGPRNALLDGRFSVQQANYVMAEILINSRCNAAQPSDYPFAGICCNGYPASTWVQKLGAIAMLLLLVVTPTAMYLDTRRTSGESSSLLRFVPQAKYYVAGLSLISGCALCWYLDRTNVFGKERKGWDQAQFFFVAISVIVTLIGLQPADKQESSFAYRGEADQWKGIAQVIILIYRYCDYASTDHIYKTYLFIMGCEAAITHLRDPENFTLKKGLATAIRLNLLRVVLSLATSRDSRLYFFPVVLTFNYLITIAVFIPYRQKNTNYLFLGAKFLAVALLTLIVYKAPVIVDVVATVLQAIFHVPGDASEWRDRLLQEPYATFMGMLAGFVYVAILQHVPAFSKLQQNPSVRRFTILANKIVNNDYTAWVGRAWLETFLLQFHIWLAADSTGLLMVGLIPANQRLINVFATTPLFLYVSWVVTNAVYGVVEYIMGADALAPTSAQSPRPTPALGEPVDLDSSSTADKERLLHERSSVDGLGISQSDNEGAGALDAEKDAGRLDPVSLEAGPGEGVAMSRRGSTSTQLGDWKVRVGVFLAVMAGLSWTYYL